MLLQQYLHKMENKKGMNAWIWVLIILILIAVGIGVYFWFFGGSAGTGIGGISVPQPPALPSG